jgi:4-alpha-glucanotransferase
LLSNLEKLLYLRGVASEYLNYSGERTVIAHELRLKFLQAAGYDVEDDQAVQQAIYQLDAAPWKSWLNPFHVLCQGESEHLDIRVHPDEKHIPLTWQLTTEEGEQRGGTFTPAELPEVGEYFIQGVRYVAYRGPLNGLPMGYHHLELSGAGRLIRVVLAVAPQRSFELDDVVAGRPWGVSCQLYTLRSARNWGMGDFSDLMELISLGAAAGMDLVGINPMHAPHMAGADFASPYSPSDRRFLNPLYIAPQQLADFTENHTLTAQFDSPAQQQKRAELRALALVDYNGVAALKYPVFEAMYQHFVAQHLARDTDRAALFTEFVQRGGESLVAFSGHESRHSGLLFHSATDPRFHQYLQWLARGQLERCQALALESGMAVGLMGDLAVGAVSGGAEVEGSPALFSPTATIGAPPDPFARDGQNWNLPALDPIALRADNYRHFIDLLRANMSCCGALRIDHVMGLMRLWWCLPGLADGAYVYYPLEDLLALLRLESHRNRCVVVGEDMGVVPDELRSRMTATSIYSNKLFYFERTPDRHFKPTQDHQADALLMVTNHDVSTLAGWWNGTDLKLRDEIGLLNAKQELPDLMLEREEDRAKLLSWLEAEQSLPAGWTGGLSGSDKPHERRFDLELCRAIFVASARSTSRLLLYQLDDLQLIEEPVNIPGTYREYPNWRRKQKLETSLLFSDPQIQALLASTNWERRQ